MEKFTKRECDVLYELLKGLENSDISKNLCISQHTTKAHLASIFKKLNVTNRLQATIKCYKNLYKKEMQRNDIEVLLENLYDEKSCI